MRLETITPVILTYNEAPNIGRCLTRLDWAVDVVVVDSCSSDGTRDIASEFRNVRLFSHTFKDHASQWLYATRETAIATEWILTLDSDYMVSDELVREFRTLDLEPGIAGYEVGFRYCVLGRPLPRSIYPPRIVLCRKDRATFYQDGHTQRLAVDGGVRRLRSDIDHDDRKSLTQWLAAQDAYARLEREKIVSNQGRNLAGADRIRALGFVAPIAVLFHCLFVKGLILQGFQGWFYTYQRVMAELILSLYLIEDRLLRKRMPEPPEEQGQGK